MSKIHKHIKAGTIFALILGSVLTLSSSYAMLIGQISGVGSHLIEQAEEAHMLTAVPVHGSPISSAKEAGREIMIGMMLILLGFVLHYLMIKHADAEEKSLPVKQGKKSDKNVVKKYFWMHIEV